MNPTSYWKGVLISQKVPETVWPFDPHGEDKTMSLEREAKALSISQQDRERENIGDLSRAKNTTF